MVVINISCPLSVPKTHTKLNLKKTKSQEQVLNEIRNLQYVGGTTALGQGIKEATKQADPDQGARPGVANKIMVVFTDGWNNKGPDPEQEAREAMAAGFQLLSVSVIVGALATEVVRSVFKVVLLPLGQQC